VNVFVFFPQEKYMVKIGREIIYGIYFLKINIGLSIYKINFHLSPSIIFLENKYSIYPSPSNSNSGCT